MAKVFFILYVADQERSAEFYTKALGQSPHLNVPGMTEFLLGEGYSLGLMPAADIKEMFEDEMPDPTRGQGLPRCEVYLILPNAETYHQRALEAGAQEISPMQKRPWGDVAAYSLDLDGHVLAFCEEKP